VFYVRPSSQVPGTDGENGIIVIDWFKWLYKRQKCVSSDANDVTVSLGYQLR